MQLGTRGVSVQFKELAATVVTVTIALKERNKKALEQGFFSEWISEEVGWGWTSYPGAAHCWCSNGSSPGARVWM